MTTWTWTVPCSVIDDLDPEVSRVVDQSLNASETSPSMAKNRLAALREHVADRMAAAPKTAHGIYAGKRAAYAEVLEAIRLLERTL